MAFSKYLLLIGLFVFGFAGRAAEDSKEQLTYLQGVHDWEELKSSQAKPCKPELDSREVLVGKKTHTAILILHGYAQNPEALEPLVRFFSQYNVNIVAPRLSHHFDEDLKALDSVSGKDWTTQTQKAFEVASKLGRRVVVVGYSLGGLLASRLALANPDSTYGLILLSPAWRLSSKMSGGANIGTIFHKSGNDYLNLEVACDSQHAYYSASGGNEIQVLQEAIEIAFKKKTSGHGDSILQKIDTPMLVATVAKDDTIDSDFIDTMMYHTQTGYRTFLVYPGTDHSTLMKPDGLSLHFSGKDSRTFYESDDLSGQIAEFLHEQVTDRFKLVISKASESNQSP